MNPIILAYRKLIFKFARQIRLLIFSKKLMNFQNITRYAKKKENFWNQIFKNSRTYGNFDNCVPPPPTSHQILEPIRILVTIFITCINSYIPYLYTYKVWRKFKDTFDTLSHPPIPWNSAYGLVLRLERWTPEGHCRCMVENMYKKIDTILASLPSAGGFFARPKFISLSNYIIEN